MKFKVYIFMTLIFLGFDAIAKPTSSLIMDIKWQGVFVYDQPINVQMNIVSQISTDQLKVNIKLPAGVDLLKGEESFTTSMQQGESRTIEFLIFVKSGLEGEIAAEATISGDKQIFYRVLKKLSFGPVGISKRKTMLKESAPEFRVIESNGEKLRDYRLP